MLKAANCMGRRIATEVNALKMCGSETVVSGLLDTSSARLFQTGTVL